MKRRRRLGWSLHALSGALCALAITLPPRFEGLPLGVVVVLAVLSGTVAANLVVNAPD